MTYRTAIIKGHTDDIRVIAAYLPSNYVAYNWGGDVLIIGEDVAGWTLDDYVIPRLGTAPYVAQEITGQEAAYGIRERRRPEGQSFIGDPDDPASRVTFWQQDAAGKFNEAITADGRTWRRSDDTLNIWNIVEDPTVIHIRAVGQDWVYADGEGAIEAVLNASDGNPEQGVDYRVDEKGDILIPKRP
jgi:hypothetical protein